MAYESPVHLIMSQMNTAFEGEVMKAVQKFCVDVDKEELMKALQYDRGQYGKGYKDGHDEVLKAVWDVLHEGVSTDTIADQDWVYEQIRNRVDKSY